jgi:hypothetical protein
MKRIVVVFLSVFCVNAFAQAPSGKIVVKKGQHFIVESSSDGSVNQEMMGQSMEMKIGSATKLTADIKDVKSNGYVITQKLTYLKSTFSGMGQEKTFDSDKKEDMDGEAGALYKDKLNVAKDIEITNDGKSVASADTAKKDSSTDANPMAAVMEMMGGGQDNITGILFLVIPSGKKSGESWKDSTAGEGMKLVRTYTLNSVANKVAAVTVNSVLDINKTMQMQGMDMNAVMTSKIVSAVTVDMASNVQKENKSTMDLTGTIDVMGQSVPITAKATSVSLVKMQ